MSIFGYSDTREEYFKIENLFNDNHSILGCDLEINTLLEEDFERYLFKNVKRGRRRANDNQNLIGHLKYERDNMLRKIKVDFHKFIITFLNSKLTQDIKNKFCRFANYCQTDITITTNKKLLNLPISELLIKVKAYKNLNNINERLYNQIKDNKCFIHYFSLTYCDFYKLYLRSREVEKLIEKEGKEIIPTLNTFISNFQRKKPKIPKKNKKNRKMSELYLSLFGNEHCEE